MPEHEVEVLSRAECLKLLPEVRVGRVGITVGALPVILPVNFALVDESIVFLTVPGTKLAAATANHVVAFEADDYETGGASGWSALVQGRASEVTEPSEKAALSGCLDAPWGVAGPADRLVRIPAEHLSGRRFDSRG